MKSSVIVKGNKYGFQIVLNPDMPFEELQRDVAKKFRESSRFFHFDQAVALSFEGRNLSEEEMNELAETITDSSSLEIGYIIDGAKASEARFAAALSAHKPVWEDVQDYEEIKEEDVTETAEGEDIPEKPAVEFREPHVRKNGQFYRGTLRSGQRIRVDGSIVILGDINPGAQVIAGGNVVVLGCLRGTVYAGYPEDEGSLVAALMMDPMQIQIGSCIARSADHSRTKPRKFGRRKHQPELEAKMAFVENGNIFIETITRSLISEISIN